MSEAAPTWANALVQSVQIAFVQHPLGLRALLGQHSKLLRCGANDKLGAWPDTVCVDGCGLWAARWCMVQTGAC
jgi:hypothetical protein